ncbi:MAG TPA: Gfo/Idh/MocA family oxidoreductase [Cyclobacteriaceae bacterium]|nr:Gfo/Idh/MocA family oxidoreductase [Cyclobacteriaceae bacterium]
MKTKEKIDRRKFLKGTALTVGSMMVSGLSVETSAYVNPPEKEIRLALVGCGGRGTGAAMQALMTKENVKLVAMADIFRDRLDSCYKALTAEKISDWSGAAGNVKDKVVVTEETKFVGLDAYKKAIAAADVVILTTPPGFRPYQMEETIRQNKHIFAEKPLATDAPGVRKLFELVKLAEGKPISIVIGLQKHFSNKYIEIMKRVHDGMIGEIVSGQIYYYSEGVWMKERKPEYTEMEYQMRNWYYFTWLCGDQIVEQHIHNIDAFNWAKQAYPVSAQGMGGRQVRTGKEYGEIYDHHYVEYSYGDDSLLNSQCRHIKGCMNKTGEKLIGTKGAVELSGNISLIRDYKGNILYDHRGIEETNAFQVEHDILFENINKGTVVNNFLNGVESTLTTILGRYASYSGQHVTRDEVLNSSIRLMPSVVNWNDTPPVLPDRDGYYPIATPGSYKVI